MSGLDPLWFDTHAHLSDSKFDADRDDVVKRAFDAGIDRIVEIADGPDEWPKARALAERYPEKMRWAAGLHPYYADQQSEDLWKNLKAIASHPQFVAIGEVGLDYAKCKIPHDVQIRAFTRAIQLAAEIDKPLIIHCREAYADLMPMLKAHFKSGAAQSPGVIHCFSGDAQNAAELVEMGFYLGIDGPITYPNSDALRNAVSKVPLERLVLETDAPYLPPQTHRGQRNEPVQIPTIGTYLSALRRSTPAEIASATTKNAFFLFRFSR